MDVQLEIVNTLKRDLKKYPARTSRLGEAALIL